MLAMEQILCELNGEEELNEQGLPPGFRFHPTDEELITFYLASKVFKATFCGVDIAEVDLNRCEPWELPDVAKMGEREWYFYSLRDRKYPTGLRTNRATGAGYWKATGKDREVYSGGGGGGGGVVVIGMKKTLVFYKGRAPRGEKTKWVMHEYRLHGHFSYRHAIACKEEWVICRIFHKNGEKKNPMLSCQSYLLESALSSSTTSNSLPPLLETTPLDHQPPFHNPILYHPPGNDDLINQSTILTTSNNNNIMYTPPPFPSTLFKSLLSHENDYSTLLLQHQQCTDDAVFKAESSCTHMEVLQPSENNENLVMDMMKKMQPNPCGGYHHHHHQYHPLFFEMECNSVAVAVAAPVVSVHHDISTSIAFNSTPTGGYQTILDPHINIVHAHRESNWPLDA